MFENITDPAALMAQIDEVAVDSKARVIKKPAFYEDYSERIAEHFDRVLQKNKEIAELDGRLFS
ncbi:hypothetical protein C3B79_1385 [Aeromonas hydrophila]|nr:hypothetical protein C3B79_1385 [Aeromonas hydrophila]